MPTLLEYGRGRWLDGSNRPTNVQRSTGAMDAARVQGEVRNTGGPVERDSDPNTPQGWLDRASEGLIVPMKRVTTVEGRGPGSGCFTRNGREGDW